MLLEIGDVASDSFGVHDDAAGLECGVARVGFGEHDEWWASRASGDPAPHGCAADPEFGNARSDHGRDGTPSGEDPGCVADFMDAGRADVDGVGAVCAWDESDGDGSLHDGVVCGRLRLPARGYGFFGEVGGDEHDGVADASTGCSDSSHGFTENGNVACGRVVLGEGALEAVGHDIG